MSPTRIHYIWRTPAVARSYGAAVSLHSHTEHSNESLEFIPRYVKAAPALSVLTALPERRFRARNEGRSLNYADAWWTPPLAPGEAHRLERRQIEEELGLRPMVSLTDHDSIEAPCSLQLLPGMREMPLSLEWTVPYSATFFHLGVHNLPAMWAAAVFERLTAYTSNPSSDDLRELLCILHGLPSVLVVFNHPLWDELGIGAREHLALVLQFLDEHREWIHALELNGLRSWQENAGVMRLGIEHEFPLISGGDRHGFEPNANVNLTNACDFAGFVSEVRDDKRSEVLFLKQYRQPLQTRLLQGVVDVLSDHQNLREDRRRWTGRVFFRDASGTAQPLSALWSGDGPAVVKLFVGGVRLVGSRPIIGAIQSALAHREEVPV